MSGIGQETVASVKIKLAALQTRYDSLLEKYELLQEEHLTLKHESARDALLARTHAQVPMEFGHLTKMESRVFGLMLSRPEHVFSKETILAECWYDRQEAEMPDLKIIDVFVCKINGKTKPHGVEIANVWGQGYKMPRESAKRLAELIASNGA